MPFRQKLKKAFGRSPSTSTSTTSASTSTSTSALPPAPSSRSAKKASKTPPQAPDPVPKYRGPVNPAHQATLSAFSFGSAAWAGRRKSGQSQYSPMGSRMPSRVGSVSSLFGREAGRKSRRQSRVEGVQEVEGDADVGNVGLSRQHTASTTHRATDTDRPLSTAGEIGAMSGLGGVRGATNGYADPVNGSAGAAGKPFTEDELALALTRSTLRA